MKVVAIIQARTNSTRFPNKIFADLAGRPLIWHVVNRLKFCKKINEIVVATTNRISDNILEDWAIKQKISCFRGEENDVLNRFHEAATKHKADIIVRITSDDPFKDPEIIDAIIEVLQKEELDFAYNNHPPSFPEGLDTEVFSFKAIELANSFAKEIFDREHVTQFFYKNPTLFNQKNLKYKKDISKLRWTIDTVEDYNMVKKIYDVLYKENEIFLLDDILNLLRKEPEISEMNTNVERSAMYK